MTTIINYNGSRFAGSSHASIDALLRLLELEPLDTEICENVSLTPEGLTMLHGNFMRISHAFSIETDNKDLLMSFYAAFDANYLLRKNWRDDREISTEAKELMRDMSIKNEQLGKDLEL